MLAQPSAQVPAAVPGPSHPRQDQISREKKEVNKQRHARVCLLRDDLMTERIVNINRHRVKRDLDLNLSEFYIGQTT